MDRIKIGTRGSALALWQAGYIQDLILGACPELEIDIQVISTQGDRDQATSLTRIGGQGLFTKAIEEALQQRIVDIAVHSLKDLPSLMPADLTIAAVPERAPVEDVFIGREVRQMQELKPGSVIASGSIRRRAQLAALRPDLRFADLRGNIDTRLKKLHQDGLDGIIMAHAAIKRLQLSDIRHEVIPADRVIPAVGQGAIAVQIRAVDNELAGCLKRINHEPTFLAITAERAYLRRLDSGCQFPVGGYARMENGKLIMTGIVSDMGGNRVLRETVRMEPAQAEDMGIHLADLLIGRGAMDLIREASE